MQPVPGVRSLPLPRPRQAWRCRTSLRFLNYFARKIKEDGIHLLCLQFEMDSLKFADESGNFLWRGHFRPGTIPFTFHGGNLVNKSFSFLGTFPRNVRNVEGEEKLLGEKSESSVKSWSSLAVGNIEECSLSSMYWKRATVVLGMLFPTSKQILVNIRKHL